MAIREIEFKPSSNIARVQWDDETLDLHVQFQHGGSGTYKGVPENEVNGLSQAESAGKYLNAQIKPLYEYERR